MKALASFSVGPVPLDIEETLDQDQPVLRRTDESRRESTFVESRQSLSGGVMLRVIGTDRGLSKMPYIAEGPDVRWTAGCSGDSGIVTSSERARNLREDNRQVAQ